MVGILDELAQLRYSRLLWPFAADGQGVDMLAASFVFFDKAGEALGPGGV
ncbi:MAG TPA: hypothetical protein VM325_16965 [Alphaproteobacteria bacterium]|nr:hypothetical protein [Alphaproteobacteria bacterium]